MKKRASKEEEAMLRTKNHICDNMTCCVCIKLNQDFKKKKNAQISLYSISIN